MMEAQDVQKIDSLRIYGRVAGNRISVELPENSGLRDVEIIIMPIKRETEAKNAADKDEWKQDFLSISQWDISENISENDMRMKSWLLPEF